MTKQDCAIYCNCGANIISDDKKELLSSSFAKLNIDVYELQDICALSLNEKDIFNSIEKEYDKKYIVACYPRAIKNMFAQNKVELTHIEILNFRETPPEEIIKTLENNTENITGSSNYRVIKSQIDVPAWYPVIDQSKCTLCGQCARFCLFGVYKYTKSSLDVINPLSCKNNCPACGRTCPASAIIFPRLMENSVLSGAEPGNATKQGQKDGLFVLLNERNTNRKKIFKPGVMRQAEEERKKALEGLKKGLGKIE